MNIAVYYTKAVRDKLVNDEAALALIDNAVQTANQVYVNSGIKVRLNLIDAARLDVTELPTTSEELNSLTDPSDGRIDEVHTKRNAVAADVVVLIAETPTCGKSFLLQTTIGQPASAFAVVDVDCAVRPGLVHEVGHIMGAHHDLYVVKKTNDTSMVLAPYAHGWTDTVRGYVSIMAYGDECFDKKLDCVGVPRFSDPEHAFGDKATADNRRVLNETALVVSKYRCSGANPIALGSRLVSTTMSHVDPFGNYWYLDGIFRDQPAEVVFDNIGNSPWDSSYALVLVEPADNKDDNGSQLLDITRVPLASGETIAPGQRKTFSFKFHGFGRARVFQWQLVDGTGKPFGDRTPQVTLQPKGM